MRVSLKSLGILALTIGLVVGWLITTSAATPAARQTIVAQDFQLLNHEGKLHAQMATTRDGKAHALWLMNNSGAAAVEFDMRPGDMPGMLVTDTSGKTFGLIRIDGSVASPILVMRSNDDIRLVAGLDLDSTSHNPFIVTFDKDGKQENQIGEYFGPGSKVQPGIFTTIMRFIGW